MREKFKPQTDKFMEELNGNNTQLKAQPQTFSGNIIKSCITLTPLSFRKGVRAGAIGVRLLGGLNILGAVGLRNGALGIPLRGAANIDTCISNRRRQTKFL